MKLKPLFLSLLLGTFTSTTLSAETNPGRGRYDNRVRVAKYVDGQVYAINVMLTRATTIEFGKGERIVSIIAGDTEGFDFESVPGDRVLALKPKARGVVTNVTVYTTQRSYYLRLKEGNSAYYAVRFNYPQSAKARSSRSVKPKSSTRRYGVSEKNQISPIAIWDDGSFTYFKFKEDAPIPAVFKVVRGMERTVNSTSLKGNIMRVSGRARQWAVRLGKTEVCIVELTQNEH